MPEMTNTPLRRPQVQATQTPLKPVKKYNIEYGPNGELFHNGTQFGNYYTSNVFEIGEERFLENWAKSNEIKLQPNIEWLEQQRTPLKREDRESDLSEQNIMKTFSVSDQARNTEKPGAEVDLSAMGNLLPLTQFTSTKGLKNPMSKDVDTTSFGKGAFPENLNPYFKN